MGSTHEPSELTEVVVDKANNIVTNAAFMCNASVCDYLLLLLGFALCITPPQPPPNPFPQPRSSMRSMTLSEP